MIRKRWRKRDEKRIRKWLKERMSEQDFLSLPHFSFNVLILSFIAPTIFSVIAFFFFFYFPLFYFYFYFYFYFIFLSSFFFLLPSPFLYFSFFLFFSYSQCHQFRWIGNFLFVYCTGIYFKPKTQLSFSGHDFEFYCLF